VNLISFHGYIHTVCLIATRCQYHEGNMSSTENVDSTMNRGMLNRTELDMEFRLDILCATHGAHIEVQSV
jgi:hypothetical protein